MMVIRAAEAVRAGDMSVRVKPRTRDELGRLALTFNAMTADVAALQRTQRSKILRMHRTTATMFDVMDDAVALTDADGKVENATRVASEVFRLHLGRPIHESGEPWLVELFQRAKEHEATVCLPADKEVLQVFVEGDEQFFYPTAVAVRNEDEAGAPEVTGVLLLMRNITQMRAQEELKRDAVSTVSHQLKTLLTSMHMALHLLCDGKAGELSHEQAELARTAREETERLRRMVEGLLDLSRIRSGRVLMECEEMDPIAVAENAVHALLGTAAEKRIDLKVDARGTMPNLWADPDRIEQVFLNLVSNAVKYTPAGGQVVAEVAHDKDWVYVHVHDSGPGVPHDERSRIFEQFYRSEGSRHEGVPGAGLGLAIARQIVDAHGGRLWVNTSPHGGATFGVALARADAVQRLGLEEAS